MHIVSKADSLQEMSKPVFRGKKEEEKNIINLTSAEWQMPKIWFSVMSPSMSVFLLDDTLYLPMIYNSDNL